MNDHVKGRLVENPVRARTHGNRHLIKRKGAATSPRRFELMRHCQWAAGTAKGLPEERRLSSDFDENLGLCTGQWRSIHVTISTPLAYVYLHRLSMISDAYHAARMITPISTNRHISAINEATASKRASSIALAANFPILNFATVSGLLNSDRKIRNALSIGNFPCFELSSLRLRDESQ